MTRTRWILWGCLLAFTTATPPGSAAEEWHQLKFDSRRSGNAADRSIGDSMGLLAAIPLSDAVFTGPVVARGKAFVLDGAGVLWAIDTHDFHVAWRFATAGGRSNVNNISSPAIIDRYLHVGTMAGTYYVLDADSGVVVREIACGEPIFSAPVVGADRVYFATLGSRVHALTPDGDELWMWDYVREHLGFSGNRWSGADWVKLKGQATWRDQFCCVRDIALHHKTLVVPAGGAVVWLDDAGDHAVQRGIWLGRRESPATLGLSLGESGDVYRQWTQRDNNGSVELLRLRDGQVQAESVPGTETAYNRPGLLAFSSVSLRNGEVFGCRPQQGVGLCRHTAGRPAQVLDESASIATPILTRGAAVFGGLDGVLRVVPLSGEPTWSFATPFGKAISAPAAVCEGRVY
ncbi:MAG: PQQ-binding-like beta-propeller repeat protein, partial [Planctomycetes bacterium]|nr:PQQ-binding-like beta-propeller repeat protein [Planctomycetota bacterium]